jgi:hypothetical protein
LRRDSAGYALETWRDGEGRSLRELLDLARWLRRREPIYGLVGITDGLAPIPSRTASPKLYRAVLFLYGALADSTPCLWPPFGHPRAVASAPLIEEAARRGISERTLREAKRLCLIDDGRAGFGPGSVPFWLPPRREFVRWVPTRRKHDRTRRKLAVGEVRGQVALFEE